MSAATGPEGRVARPVQFDVMDGFAIGPDDTVVDVGCGAGVGCRYAGMAGAAVVGLDVEPGLVREADEAMRGVPARSWRGIVSGGDPIPLPDGTATVVLCTEVLEHVDDPPRFVAELARIGRPGARYLISVPDPASEDLMRQIAPPWYWRPPFHRRVFSRPDLDALLAAAGLKVERRELQGFHVTMRWLFWSTLGVGPYDPGDGAPVLTHWDAAWDAFAGASGTAPLIRALDRVLPKSQVVLAVKPGGATGPRLRRGLGSLSDWKRRLRFGTLRLGPVELSWTLRRSRPGG